jgi:hypothetical protein
MGVETNVCFYCKRLVTFTSDTCPQCDKPKKFIFDKALQERKAEKARQEAEWNKNEIIRLRNLKLSDIQWEYIKVMDPAEHELNKLGAYGWELAAIYSGKQHLDENHQEFIFKRIFKR